MTAGQNNLSYHIIEKPDWISYETITEVLHDAHNSNTKKGMHFIASYQDAAVTERRLGEDGLFFIALTDDHQIAGVGAVSMHKSCKGWYGKNKPFGEIKMVGVPEKYKGHGVSSALYRKMEEYAFSMCDFVVMNTASNNHIVLDSNARHDYKYVDYKSWANTDYYSPCMAKWKDGCPYNDMYCALMYACRKFATILLKRENGKLRFPFRLLKKNNSV